MSRRRRGRKTGPSHQQERWLITYADLLTLLLIFFVIMYGVSSVDEEKYEAVSASLQTTFQAGSNILDGGPKITGEAGQQIPGSGGNKQGDNADPEPEKDPDNAVMTERERQFREQEQQMQNFLETIQSYVTTNNLQDQIFVADKPQGISITLSDRFLFDVGQADLKSGAAGILDRLSSLFGTVDAMISIEGHTDNQPIRGGRYGDNWELSGARALSVLRYFIDVRKLDPAQFQYAGYADTRPVGDNATAEGRQQNRRVEITVLRQLRADTAAEAVVKANPGE
ncbi:flagellar motor protein MotB [Saccharibacillus sp. CPCC 101409]|uniref:flagellar motor protein MotB n=1 Tax=Saccharibacillus sp. CPCC 101409 TaxID=3058041 RepID=UPI0026712F71|nr:flagellar motor protein MotB [Saccharibacillus sp. CPCC 101409]MDO3412036.1 flagellar motor protein MotB [Saccharibacillus sp. CPCC 101409]